MCGEWEVGEPRLLGQGRWGPIIRARHAHTLELVGVKVFNAEEAYRTGRVAHCASSHEARVRAFRAFCLEVSALKRLGGAHPATLRASQTPNWLQELGSCAHAVVRMLGFSMDEEGQPAESEDGCCYLVMELGVCTLGEFVSSRPSAEEIQQATRELFTVLADLHRAGCVLRSHSPRCFMRFESGWKLLAASELRPAGFTVRAASFLADESNRTAPWHLAPEYAKLLAKGEQAITLQPSADVWSLALFCLEMTCEKPLLQEAFQLTRCQLPSD